MNDFLQSLRNGTMKRQDRNRKQFDNPQHRNGERGGNRDKRNPNARKSFGGPDLGEIKKLLQAMSDNTELTRIAQERAAEALERIAVSLHAMAQSRETISETTVVQHAATPLPPAEIETEAAEMAEDLRQRTLAVIRSLHDNGDSFETISRYLNDQRIPTFSGKGSWRAQNVSRALNAARKQA
jgi:hypothetical protein